MKLNISCITIIIAAVIIGVYGIILFFNLSKKVKHSEVLAIIKAGLYFIIFLVISEIIDVFVHLHIWHRDILEYTGYGCIIIALIFLAMMVHHTFKLGKTYGFAGSAFAELITLEEKVKGFMEKRNLKLKKGINAKYLLKRGFIDKKGVFKKPLPELKKKGLIIGEIEERIERWIDTY